jgi:hypothetical protein
VVALMVLWLVLALVYCPILRAVGFYLNRRVGWNAGWKVAGAGLMPGAMLVNLGLVGYGALGLDLIRLGLVFLLHLVAGWVFLLATAWFLPGLEELEVPSNPFIVAPKPPRQAPPEDDNPFGARH